MKIRNADAAKDKAELNMTSMIDIVFQLLVFFIMTFKITAMEGDFNVKMPRASSQNDSIDKPFDEPIKIELKADTDGSILEIIVDGESKGTSFQSLANFVVAKAGAPGPERDKIIKDTEIEFDCDYDLKYEEVIAGITAVSGKRRADNEIEKLFEKIKFKDQPKR
ncbi:MAG: biopolymer transporter ExbD [Planctomycetota bacterium]|nr:biopolymer transporter ExbD [Planctomycetota bacterium]